MSSSIIAATGGQAIAFYLLAALTIASAVLMLVQKNPVASVLWLVLCFVGLAGLFLVLNAYFIAAIQVLVYAGAIMVLFLFVIMLLNLRGEDIESMKMPKVPLVGLVAAVLFLGIVAWVIAATEPFKAPLGDVVAAASEGEAEIGDSVKAIGVPLFRKWLLPFEVTSILLLAAIVGAVALTKKKL